VLLNGLLDCYSPCAHTFIFYYQISTYAPAFCTYPGNLEDTFETFWQEKEISPSKASRLALEPIQCLSLWVHSLLPKSEATEEWRWRVVSITAEVNAWRCSCTPP